MKKIKETLFSMQTSVILLLIFGISIGYATFAENSHGTEYARQIVYNAKWFEVLLLLLIVNLLGSIFRYDLINRKKWSILLFHLAFILMIVGAAVTRYFGYEGIMHIRDGQTSDEITSDKNSVKIVADYNGTQVVKMKEVSFSATQNNTFSESLTVGGKTIQVDNEMFIPNAVETIVPDDNGQPALSLFVMNHQNEGSDFILMNGENESFDGISFAFQDTVHTADIRFELKNNQLYFISKIPVATMGMMDKSETMLAQNEMHPVIEKTIYKAGNVIFVLKAYMEKARKNLTQMTSEMNKSGLLKEGKDAEIFKVSDGNITKRVNVLMSENSISQPAVCRLGDVKVSVTYGMQPRKLPFSITLRAFQLDRYPGSDSPSSYASEITVNDYERKTELPYRIYMNNILNYRGYRFFQSSYDEDQRGTILSVSHDYWGTLISYLGYFLMTLGMGWTLFNKNSRFRHLMKVSNGLRSNKQTTKILSAALLIFVSVTNLKAQEPTPKAHFEALKSLLVQDPVQGRIEPFDTYASDILRKISKKSSYHDKSADEVLLGMMSNPSQWENEPFIKIANKQLAAENSAINGYVSFHQLFDYENGGVYRLKDKVDQAYQKQPSMRNEYDKEVMNVDERVNICYQIFNGMMVPLFPVINQPDGKWTTGAEEIHNPHGWMNESMGMNAPSVNVEGKMPPHGMGGMTDEQIQAMMGNAHSSGLSQPNSPRLLLENYFQAVRDAGSSGNWGAANDALQKIKNYQRINGGDNLPSEAKIKAEIFYNQINPFLELAIVYILFGLLLLSLYLINVFRVKPLFEKGLNYSYYAFIVLFALYSGALLLRWYISGHAPWSNGYESMIFVGWAAALSGLVFARKSPAVMAVTGILSSIALFTAAMSWMNPEITNLVPVLKSYWLIVHVAVITSSYGFLAMGALLGFLNLILMISRNEKNTIRIAPVIQEISYIIEMTLIIGLFMLTVGCFIGGVWANESWGRYWGWDPKETWALVSILVYSAVLHLRNVPKLNNQFTLSTLSLLSFGTIIMTFLGVNYYLSGMHSYGQGTPPEIPSGVYFVLLLLVIVIGWAYNSEKKNKQINS